MTWWPARQWPAADMPWLFRYVPFANLYDLSLAFAFGAGITTLLVMRRQHFRAVAALSLPLAAIVVFLALWGWVAPTVQTSLGAVPSISRLWGRALALVGTFAIPIEQPQHLDEGERRMRHPRGLSVLVVRLGGHTCCIGTKWDSREA